LLDLARQPGGSWPVGPRRPGVRSLEAGADTAGCRSWPASWGDHGRWAPVPDWFAAAVAGVGANTGIFGNKKMAASMAAREEGGMFKKGKQRARVYPFQADTGIGPYHRFP
jgi:hypothetical protein